MKFMILKGNAFILMREIYVVNALNIMLSLLVHSDLFSNRQKIYQHRI